MSNISKSLFLQTYLKYTGHTYTEKAVNLLSELLKISKEEVVFMFVDMGGKLI